MQYLFMFYVESVSMMFMCPGHQFILEHDSYFKYLRYDLEGQGNEIPQSTKHYTEN